MDGDASRPVVMDGLSHLSAVWTANHDGVTASCSGGIGVVVVVVVIAMAAVVHVFTFVF